MKEDAVWDVKCEDGLTGYISRSLGASELIGSKVVHVKYTLDHEMTDVLI